MGGLKQRVVTAAVLAPLVVAAVLWLPTQWFALLLAMVLLVGADEWSTLAGSRPCGVFLGFLLALAAALLVAGWWLFSGMDPLPVFLGATLWWGWTGLRLLRIREIRVRQAPSRRVFIAGILVLTLTWMGLVWLHGQARGPLLVLFLLTLTWAADSGAYFTGRRWGRVKLAPVVSPGKTREGVYGALAGGLLWGLALAWGWGEGALQQAGLVLLSLVAVLASIVGDLYESLLKRERGVKDSGSLLPGHGGLLDRIDSLTAVAPVFALGIMLLTVDG